MTSTMEILSSFTFGDATARFDLGRETGRVGLVLFPTAMADRLATRRRSLRGLTYIDAIPRAGDPPAIVVDPIAHVKDRRLVPRAFAQGHARVPEHRPVSGMTRKASSASTAARPSSRRAAAPTECASSTGCSGTAPPPQRSRRRSTTLRAAGVQRAGIDNENPVRRDGVKSGRWDSNPRRQPWEGCILPLNYARKGRPQT
jgi:hypothetical protein